MIQVTVNGEIRQFEPATKLSRLIENMGLAGKRLALERNGEIVPRSRLDQETLAHGDSLEIVVAVGGG